MNPLSLKTKIILCSFYLISLIYGFSTFVFELIEHNDMIHYSLVGVIFLINFLLIFRIYSYKNIQTDIKIPWYIILVLFGILGVYYIWKVDDKFWVINSNN